MMNRERIMAETDILRYMDNVFCMAGAFGFGTEESHGQRTARADVDKCLGIMKLNDRQQADMETLVNKLMAESETTGFKKGFCIALRIMIEGLQKPAE